MPSNESFSGVPRLISPTAEYALRAAVYLTQHHPEPQTSARIARGTRVPGGYLLKLLQSLVRGGLVRSRRGLHGGFTLARPPAGITVLAVLEAVDPAPRENRDGDLGAACPVDRLVRESVARARGAFAAASLEDISASARGITPLRDHPDPPPAPVPPRRTVVEPARQRPDQGCVKP